MGPADSGERQRLHAAKTCGQYINEDKLDSRKRSNKDGQAKREPSGTPREATGGLGLGEGCFFCVSLDQTLLRYK